jgi:hypothetical protein
MQTKEFDLHREIGDQVLYLEYIPQTANIVFPY